MNKYQGALDRLFMWATNGYCALEVPSEEYEDLKEIMQELVDKATPKKPIFYVESGYFTDLCPVCKCMVDADDRYCSYCGQRISQRLSWSEVEENCDEE